MFVAINAKYIHSNLAVRYLKRYAAPALENPPQMLECTINHRADWILEEIFRCAPDVVLFSTYLWNVTLVCQLAAEYRKLHPEAVIGVGGPQVSYESAAFLAQNPALDLVIRGEGEQAVRQLLEAIQARQDWRSLLGLTVRDGSQIRENPPQPPLDLALLPFPYEPDFSDAPDQIKYYESSRGCPFQCQYCLSSIERGVRNVPLERVFADLTIFLNAKVRQVKFVDRTFNCDIRRAIAIWRFLRDHDNGVTNFHFEITAELLTRDALDFLGTIRPEQFQFEIGVQSTNPRTLQAVRRQNDWPALCAIVREIKSFRNIHQHLDLIAGLPYENYDSFHRSFNDVYALEPEQLQLGFLKILKGSGLYRDQEKYGLVYRDYPPFEILFTPALPFQDALRLKAVEEMVELYYNSGRFVHALRWLFSILDDPFAFYQALGERYVAQQYPARGMTLDQRYAFFYQFCAQIPSVDAGQLAEYLKLDYCLHQRPKRRQEWFGSACAPVSRQQCLALLAQPSFRERYLPGDETADPKQLYKLLDFESFCLDVLTGEAKPVVLLLDYRRRDLLGNALALPVVLPADSD